MKTSHGFAHFVLLFFATLIVIGGIILYSFHPTDYESCNKIPGSSEWEMHPPTCKTIWGESFTLQTDSPNEEKPSETNTSDWKTYEGEKFRVMHPFSWYPKEIPVQNSETESVFLNDGLSKNQPPTNQVRVTCPQRLGDTATELPNPYEWEPNEGGYYTKYYNELTINNYPAIQYIWDPTEDDNRKPFTELCTSLLREPNPLVCELCTTIESKDNYTPEYINNLKTYNQILSTFEFLNSNNENIDYNSGFTCPTERLLDCTPCTSGRCPLSEPQYCSKGSTQYTWITKNCPDVEINLEIQEIP